VSVDFVVASSYGAGTTSSGTVRLTYDPETDLRGTHVLLVEDIVDSGRTVEHLVQVLRSRGPKSLEVCTLLHKHLAHDLRVPVRFVGFAAPPGFLVGYGLDHAEQYRHLPNIVSLE
jgi:hypoxanthine phosphoribosyltransferase